MVNLFGNGFIGSNYHLMYPCIVNERNDLIPKTNEILYTISTVDNHTFKVNPFIDIETNLTTLIRVLENCKKNSTVFNFLSSWFVYGAAENANEDTPCSPIGFYSITKRAAEQLLIEYASAHNIKYRILRLANVVGPGDKKTSNKKNILSYLINQIRNNEKVTLSNHGEFKRNYIHVKDVCKAINLILTEGLYNEIYNVGAHTETLKNVVSYAYLKCNSKSTIVSKKENVLSSSIDCSKIQSLGFTPSYSISDIIDELINEYN